MSSKLTWLAWQSGQLPLTTCSIRGSTRPGFWAGKSSSITTKPTWILHARHFTSAPASSSGQPNPVHYTTKEVQERMEHLGGYSNDLYPRYTPDLRSRSVRSLIQQSDLTPEPPVAEIGTPMVQVSGRIVNIRQSGSKLAFLDITEEQLKLQVVISLNALADGDRSKERFSSRINSIRRGDHITITTGGPYRAANGQASVKATHLPVIQSPCLNRFPVEQRGFAMSEASEIHYHGRHVEMLTDPEVIETMKARSIIIRSMRNFFEGQDFTEVQTPIISALAGGANAKPFEMIANEFPHRQLNLRIAPELWLKRLIIGGLHKVFEIGPSFRNEGLDKTHNPEFTTCEFYAVRQDLSQLMSTTKDLLITIARSLSARGVPSSAETRQLMSSIEGEYQVLDFIPALNDVLKQPLPTLSSPTAQADLTKLFQTHSIPLPTHPSLPRLLDKLSSIYLEPLSTDRPTWITNIPACLSPLAKSHPHPTYTQQPVAARAELFIHGKEVVNCYEEENDPFAQRRKFIEQQVYARQPRSSVGGGGDGGDGGDGRDSQSPGVDEEAMHLDEDYLRALEWGLPPTGGWGCGVDRLVMLFTGRERIGDVLSFGNLRAVTRGAEKKYS